jgi:hypothetical protein
MGLLSKAVSGEESQTDGEILPALRQAFAGTSALRGLVFETESPLERVGDMVSGFASVSEIRAGRYLILGKPSLDSGLLAHRLAASVQGKELLSFSAANPREAQTALKRCL